MARILITGAGGFIGSHLADDLSKDNEVLGLGNFCHEYKHKGDYDIVYGDVRYVEDIDEHIKNCDIVYHLAAQINVDKSIKFPQETMDINLQGTKNVLDCVKKYNKTMVFASTSEVYGGHTEKITEESETRAQSPYAVAKLAADKLCQNYWNLYQTRVFILRCFNVFGPRQGSGRFGAVIPIFSNLIKQNKPPVIFGTGEQRRDYVYVSDVVRAYRLVPTIDELLGKPINVGTEVTHSINEIAEMLIKINNKDLVPIHDLSRKGEVSCLMADITKIKSYGWEPKVTFEKGLRRI